MRILHLSSEKSWRGGEQQMAYLIEEHLKNGVEIWVATRIHSEFSKYCNQRNINYIDLDFKGSFDLKTVKSIGKICKTNKIDLIHAHSGKSHALSVLNNVFGKEIPIVLSRRVDFPIKNNPWAKWKYNHNSIKKIICVSNAIKLILTEKIIVKSKLTTIHSGIDTDRFSTTKNAQFLRKKYKLSKETLLIGNTSAIAPHKDYYTFVDTCETLIKAGVNARYFIIGSGPNESEIKDYVKEKDLQSHIIFTGFLSNIEAVLPELDLFLITSTTEGLGTSILDSFASKVPVVATKAGGIPELVIDEVTGLLCPIKDPHCLSEKVMKIVNDSDLKQKIITGASGHLQEFTKEKTARKTLAVYNNILSL